MHDRVLSSLFNLYSDQVFQEALDNASDAMKINGRLLNSIRYTDDTVVIAHTSDGLQRITDSILTTGKVMDLSINITKKKYS